MHVRSSRTRLRRIQTVINTRSGGPLFKSPETFDFSFRNYSKQRRSQGADVECMAFGATESTPNQTDVTRSSPTRVIFLVWCAFCGSGGKDCRLAQRHVGRLADRLAKAQRRRGGSEVGPRGRQQFKTHYGTKSGRMLSRSNRLSSSEAGCFQVLHVIWVTLKIGVTTPLENHLNKITILLRWFSSVVISTNFEFELYTFGT